MPNYVGEIVSLTWKTKYVSGLDATCIARHRGSGVQVAFECHVTNPDDTTISNWVGRFGPTRSGEWDVEIAYNNGAIDDLVVLVLNRKA